jgi:regulator of sigma E protease
MAGDVITAIDSTALLGWYDMHRVVKVSAGKLLSFTINRNGQTLVLPVTPSREIATRPDGTKEPIGRIGVRIPSTSRKTGPGEAFNHAVGQTWFFASSTFDFFIKLVTGKMSPKLLGGPVMIAEMAGESAKTGFSTLIGFTAFISINLAVLNLLPFPVLDGGHIAIIIAETVTRRKITMKAKMAVQQAGTIVLLLLMFYVTFNDILRIETITRFFGVK